MPKRIAVGVVTNDGASQTRRVELPRVVRHRKYMKYLRRRTVCHVHDEKNESRLGDTVEIRECPPLSRNKRWELVRVVRKSTAVDMESLREAHRRGAREEAAAKELAKLEAGKTPAPAAG
ncbi:MAG: 30S ribosomal protein S17 [Planctomycetia bacterium]|nr:30S ribosomal protein S17 [Planctomycetia bacterium]